MRRDRIHVRGTHTHTFCLCPSLSLSLFPSLYFSPYELESIVYILIERGIKGFYTVLIPVTKQQEIKHAIAVTLREICL